MLDGKSYQIVRWCWVSSGFLRATLFLVQINDRPGDVICGIAIFADSTTLYSNCDWASDVAITWVFFFLSNLIFKALRIMVGEGLLTLMQKKLNLLQLIAQITGALDVKVNRCVLDEKSPFKKL